jgi:hypothetical protein
MDGNDTSTFAGPGYTPDLDTLGRVLSAEEAVIQDMLRAITEQPGVLFWAPRATFNISSVLQAGMTDADISSLESIIATLFEDDPRYESFSAKATLTGGTLSVVMSAVTIAGQAITLKVTDDGTGLEYERLT